MPAGFIESARSRAALLCCSAALAGLASASPLTPPQAPASRAGKVDRPGLADDRYVRPFCADLCFVRANEDDTPDLVLWSGGWHDAHLVAVDGATGRSLWATPKIPHMADSYLHCVDAASVVVGVSDFTVRALEARSGQERWRTRLSDMPKDAAAGAGCILAHTQDGANAGLSLATGARQACATKEPPTNFRQRQLARARQPLSVAGLTIRLLTRPQGTPMLTLTGARGKQPAWQTPLEVYSDTPHAMSGLVAYNDRGVFVGGRNLSDSIDVALLAVDPHSGRLLWKRDFEGSIEFLVTNGPRLYAGVGGRVRALDPATGQDLWQAVSGTPDAGDGPEPAPDSPRPLAEKAVPRIRIRIRTGIQ